VSLDKIRAENDVIGLYFSAHWCPPCRGFTPVLAKAYNKLREAGSKIEIIFLSSDRDQVSWQEYYATMPWKAVPYKSPLKENLGSRFNVEGIPTLILLNKDLKLISRNGRGLIEDDLEGYPWTKPKPLQKCSGEAVTFINEGPVFLLFTTAADEKKHTELFTPVAEEFIAEWEAKGLASSEFPLRLIIAGESGMGARVKDFLNVSRLPSYLIVNLPDQKKYLPSSAELSVDAVKGFIRSYLGNREGLVVKSPRQ